MLFDFFPSMSTRSLNNSLQLPQIRISGLPANKLSLTLKLVIYDSPFSVSEHLFLCMDVIQVWYIE